MFAWSMYGLHELLRHHPAYLMGRPSPLADFERLERRPITNDELRSVAFDAPAWRLAEAVAAVALVALAIWGVFVLTTGSTDGSAAVETIAEGGAAVDRSR